MNVGDTFLQYRILSLLGEGGNGYTYRVSKDGSDFTLKELRQGFKQGWDTYKKGMEMFERECRALRTISHPLVPRFVESHVDKSESTHRCFLVNEFVPGETLTARVQSRQLTLEEITSVALNITSVLEHTHSFAQPIIHRDIKPDNIIMSPDGLAHLIDFGSVNVGVAMSKQYTTAGTPGFAPPESLYEGDPRPEADIYGLGATLLYLFSGGKDIIRMTDMVTFSPKIKGNVPAEFELILERMMARDYLARATVKEVRDFFSRREVVVGELVDDDTSLVLRHSSEGDRRVREEWIQRTLAKEKGAAIGMSPHTQGRVSSDLEVHGGASSIINPIINHPKMHGFEGGIVLPIEPTIIPDLPGNIIRKGDTAPMPIVAAEDGLEGVVELSKPRYIWPKVNEMDGVQYRTGEILRACCEVLFPQGRGVPIYNLVPDTFVPIETKISTAYKDRNLTSRFKDEVVTWQLRANIIRDDTIDREQSYLELVRDNRSWMRRGVQRVGHYDADTTVIMNMRVYERRRAADREGGNDLLDYLIDYNVLMDGDLSFCVNKGKENYQKGKFNYPDIKEKLRFLPLTMMQRDMSDEFTLASPAVRFIYNNGVLSKNLVLGESHEHDGLCAQDLDGFYPPLPRNIIDALQRHLSTPSMNTGIALVKKKSVQEEMKPPSIAQNGEVIPRTRAQGVRLNDLMDVDSLDDAELAGLGLPQDQLYFIRAQRVLRQYVRQLIPPNKYGAIDALPLNRFVPVRMKLLNEEHSRNPETPRTLYDTWRLRAHVGEYAHDAGKIVSLELLRDMRGLVARFLQGNLGSKTNCVLRARIYERPGDSTTDNAGLEYLLEIESHAPEIYSFWYETPIEVRSMTLFSNSIIHAPTKVPRISYLVLDGEVYRKNEQNNSMDLATLTNVDLARFFPTPSAGVYKAAGRSQRRLPQPPPLELENVEPMTKALAERDLVVAEPNGSITGGDDVSRSLALVPANSSEGRIVQTENDDLIARIQGVARKFVDGMFPRARGMVTNPDNMWLPDVERIVGPSLLDLQENKSRLVTVHRYDVSQNKYIEAKEYWSCRFKKTGETVFFIQDRRNTFGKVFGKNKESHLLFALDFYQRVEPNNGTLLDNYVINARATKQENAQMLRYDNGKMLHRGVLATQEISQIVLHGRTWNYEKGVLIGERQVTQEDAQGLIPYDKYVFSQMTTICPEQICDENYGTAF